MTARTCLKHPLCVEWTTQLPREDAPRRSPSISLRSSDWFLELIYENALKEYSLFLCHSRSANVVLNEPIFVTTFVKEASGLDKPILFNHKTFFQSHSVLWIKTRAQIVDQIPDIFRICKFTITCLFHSTETHLEKIDASTQTTARLQTLSSDFSTFLKDETFSDVRLICEDRTFSAHRYVLAARSEVFAAMFRHKMAETEHGVVHINGMDPEALELLLEYVYSGEMPDLLENTAPRLYEAADKYAVHSLRDACSDWMVEHQTPENCLDFLVLADEHSDNKFVEAVVCFSSEHLASLSLESWSTLKETYPRLMSLVLKKRRRDQLNLLNITLEEMTGHLQKFVAITKTWEKFVKS